MIALAPSLIALSMPTRQAITSMRLLVVSGNEAEALMQRLAVYPYQVAVTPTSRLGLQARLPILPCVAYFPWNLLLIQFY